MNINGNIKLLKKQKDRKEGKSVEKVKQKYGRNY